MAIPATQDIEVSNSLLAQHRISFIRPRSIEMNPAIRRSNLTMMASSDIIDSLFSKLDEPTRKFSLEVFESQMPRFYEGMRLTVIFASVAVAAIERNYPLSTDEVAKRAEENGLRSKTFYDYVITIKKARGVRAGSADPTIFLQRSAAELQVNGPQIELAREKIEILKKRGFNYARIPRLTCMIGLYFSFEGITVEQIASASDRPKLTVRAWINDADKRLHGNSSKEPMLLRN
jgi:transcription initiation factor TFIIIB Brf1 subunit/transcription initiation factor TFIIB